MPTRVSDRTAHPAKEVHGDRPQRCHVLRPVAGTDAGGVLTEGHIPHIMDLVLDAPLSPHDLPDAPRAGLAGGQAGDHVHRLPAALPGRPHGAVPGDADDLTRAGEVRAGEAHHLHHPRIDAAVSAYGGAEGGPRAPPGHLPARLPRPGLVAPDREGVVRAELPRQHSGVLAPGVQRVRDHHRVLQLQRGQQRGEAGDLAALCPPPSAARPACRPATSLPAPSPPARPRPASPAGTCRPRPPPASCPGRPAAVPPVRPA